jgi:2-hydroxychromene-2-carboxylate isomerase
MKRLLFHFDVISPYAYLAFEHLPQALEGCHYQVEYRPVLLAGLLKAFGQKGPAEIPAKRAWMLRHMLWLAEHHGLPLQMPAVHPFNPLALLRLSLACSATPGALPNRYQVEALMRHVWRADGADPNDPARLAPLRAHLQPVHDPEDPAIKSALTTLTAQAVAAGVFGVPMMTLVAPDGQRQSFWGMESLPLLREALQRD